MNKGKAWHNKQCSKRWQQVSDTPWLTQKSLAIVDMLLTSYKNSFGERLLISSKVFDSPLEKGQMLFALQNPVMAHDIAKDPHLNYANASALQRWDRCWEEMVGMPSRLTAPEEERDQRKHALKQAIDTHAIKSYQGIRIDSKGNRFIIKNARIWTLWDKKGHAYGQAATFNEWQRI